MKKSKKSIYPTGGVVRNYIESPDEALAENEIALAKAKYKAETNPWATGLSMLGNMAISYAASQSGQAGNIGNALKGANAAFASHAMGGKVGAKQVEVEGGEIIETPTGKAVEMQGPSHAQGGIDMILPVGTDIFSDRLTGPDGKTMAERKKKREKKIKQLEKALSDNPTDQILKKTLETTKSNYAKQEKQDMDKMEFARGIMDGLQVFAYGGTIGDPPSLEELFQNQEGMDYLRSIYSADDPGNTSMVDFLNSDPQTMSTTVDTPTEQSNRFGDTMNRIFDGGDGTGITFGDGIGIAGDLISTFGPMRNTLKARSKDRPNENYYKDFGNDALDAIENAKGYVAGQRDNAIKQIDIAKTGSINRLRNSARGVNTMRAGDIATEMGANQQKVAAIMAFAQQMQGLFGQQAGLENVQDQMVMTGEKERDINDRMDQDNFYTQLAQDISTMGTGLQKTGKDVNAVKTRNVTQTTLNQMYDNFKVNAMTGEIKTVAQQELATDPGKYEGMSPDTFNKVIKGLTTGQYTWQNGVLYDKTGSEVDINSI